MSVESTYANIRKMLEIVYVSSLHCFIVNILRLSTFHFLPRTQLSCDFFYNLQEYFITICCMFINLHPKNIRENFCTLQCPAFSLREQCFTAWRRGQKYFFLHNILICDYKIKSRGEAKKKQIFIYSFCHNDKQKREKLLAN